MKSSFVSTRITLAATLFLTTIIITPWFSFDSINIPKFSILSIGGSILCIQLLVFRKSFFKKEFKTLVVILSVFIIWQLVAFFNSNMNYIEGFFGVDGRKTGIFTYLFFVVIFYISCIFSSQDQSRNFIKILIVSGVLSTIYAIVQILNLDPFNWNTPYKPIFGFFGNSNFLASFLGMSASASLALILISSLSRIIQLTLIVYIFSAIFVIYKSESEQGYFVFLAGLLITVYVFLKNSKRFKKYQIGYSLAVLSGFLTVVLDIFQKTPWKSILYSPSISERGEFWRAAIKMTTDNPITGIGLDGFRDSYHRYRDISAATRDPAARVTSAHNVFLDISSGGGFPLLFLYLLIIFMVIRSVIKVISSSTKPDIYFISLVSAWAGYLLQSFVSINHLGIAIWGWALGGAIVGYDIKSKLITESINSKTHFARNISVAFGLIIGLLISSPELVKDAQFRAAIKSGNGDKIIALSTQWPQSMDRINLAAGIFLENDFTNQAEQIVNYGVKFNPDNLFVWQILYSIPEISTDRKVTALSRIKELDPLNPQFKND
jgi:O-antigen ligase